MIGVTIKVDAIKRSLDAYAQKLHDVAQTALKDATDAAEASALLAIRAQTTRRTGSLEDDWSSSWRGPYARGLFNFSDHASFIELGTPPHRIEAKRGMLAFQMAGAMMFRRAVNHPGTKARPFLAVATTAGELALRDSARAGLDRIAREF